MIKKKMIGRKLERKTFRKLAHEVANKEEKKNEEGLKNKSKMEKIIKEERPNESKEESIFDMLKAEVKPMLRGKIHLCLIIFYIILLPQLLKKCSSSVSFTASIISSVCILFNFSASALLHNINWSAHYRSIMEKLDYTAIFVMIGGSTTPVPMLLFDVYDAICLTVLQTICFIYGFVNIYVGKISEKRKTRSLTYVLTGLVHVLFLNCYINVLTTYELILVLLLGGMYLLGVVVYAIKWPNPFPKYFGFHEVFHLCCLVSATCTYILNFSVLSRAG